jgi:hypothetical protein
LTNKEAMIRYKENTILAAKDLNWQKEEQELMKIYSKVKGFGDK